MSSSALRRLPDGSRRKMTGDYRFLLMESETGAVHDMTLVCLNDSDAMLIARGIGGGRDVEVWDHHRLVGCVHARPPRGAEAAA
jgi:hypothetical protein